MRIDNLSAGAIGLVAMWVALGATLTALIIGRRRYLALGAVALVTACLALVAALLASDFSLAYVVKTTSLATPWWYRISALWGGMEGSLLFYAAVTAAVCAVAFSEKTAVRLGAAVSLVLVGLVLAFADPFSTLDLPPVDGDGLLAILQHPAMIYHPPLLYLGLTTTVVPFALAWVASRGGAPAERWLQRARGWTFVSWTLLVLGMAAGSNWAYVELGWGGFWAWDPVENTALMPWLAATMFVHTSRVEMSRGWLRRSNVFLAGMPFALTVAGIYLTRSGVTGSIHSFAEDPVVGGVLLSAMVFVLAGLAYVAIRSERGAPIERLRLDGDGWLVINVLLLAPVLAFVMAGSLTPAFRSVFQSETVVVDSRFFVMTILPLAALVAVSLALALGVGLKPFLFATTLGAAIGLLVFGPGAGLWLFAPALGAAVCLLIRLASLRPRSRTLVSHLAHLGISVLLVGVAGSSFGDEFEGPMRPGDSVAVAGHEITLISVETGETDRYLFVRAPVSVGGRGDLSPEIRAYDDQNLPVSEPAISPGLNSDVIVAISLLFPDGETVDVSVFVRPLVSLVWLGALLILIAGLVYLFSTDGASVRRHRSATGGQRREGTTSGTDAR